VAQLTRALPGMPPHLVVQKAKLLMRWGATLQRLAEESCNGHPAQGMPATMIDAAHLGKLQAAWDRRIEHQEERIQRLAEATCKELGMVPNFGGDPRGYVFKVHLCTGASNTWGGKEEGYGVPS